MSAGRFPASGSGRSPAPVNPLERVLRVRYGLAVTRRTPSRTRLLSTDAGIRLMDETGIDYWSGSAGHQRR